MDQWHQNFPDSRSGQIQHGRGDHKSKGCPDHIGLDQKIAEFEEGFVLGDERGVFRHSGGDKNLMLQALKILFFFKLTWEFSMVVS